MDGDDRGACGDAEAGDESEDQRRRARRAPPPLRPRYPEETLVDPPVIRVEPPDDEDAGSGD